MNDFQNGFTLIELMVVVAILGIMVAVAEPNYKKYLKKAKEGACLSEAREYSSRTYYQLNDLDNTRAIAAPIFSACESITDATGWTLQTQQKIIAVAKSPSNARIECDIPNGSPCRILP